MSLYSTLFVLLFPAFAHADELLLHEGDPSAAVSAVSADGAIPPWSLDPTPIATFLQGSSDGAAILYGDGRIDPTCSRPTSNSELLKALSEGEAAVKNQRWPLAIQILERALSAVPCLGEPAEASTIAQLHYLRGIVSVKIEGTEAARQSFAQAVQYKPGLVWDTNYPPEGQPLFEASRETLREVAELRVLGAVQTLWIDGQARSPEAGVIRLSAGTHLVQVPGTPTLTWTVRVDAALPAHLVDPRSLATLPIQAFPNDPLVSALLDLGRPKQTAWLRTTDATWRYDGAWTRLPPAPVDPAALRKQRGAALTAGGLVAMGLGFTSMAFCVTQAFTTSYAEEWEQTTDQQRWRLAIKDKFVTGAVAGGVTGGLGIVAAGAGIQMTYSPKPE